MVLATFVRLTAHPQCCTKSACALYRRRKQPSRKAGTWLVGRIAMAVAPWIGARKEQAVTAADLTVDAPLAMLRKNRGQVFSRSE